MQNIGYDIVHHHQALPTFQHCTPKEQGYRSDMQSHRSYYRLHTRSRTHRSMCRYSVYREEGFLVCICIIFYQAIVINQLETFNL